MLQSINESASAGEYMEFLGKQFYNYRLIRYLGKGSFGEVYLAEHVSKPLQYAIKLLRTRLTSENLLDFLNEARTVRLQHPNIMRIQDFGVVDDVPFLVMDYVSGGTMRQRHPYGTRIPLQSVVGYVKQISEALQYAHDDGLVHRDVKPENMLIGANNEILLSDFGIVTTSYTWSPGNASGVAGTALYMAPEQIQAKPVRASDQYALAAIVFEWLTGTPPFRGTIAELTVQHLTQPPPPLSDHLSDVPEAVEQVIMKGLAKDPKERFASIKEFAKALEQASKLPIGTTLSIFRGHTNWITAVSWSPDGVAIASASNDRTVRVWNAEKATTLYIYYGHAGAVTAAAWSPDGTRIVSASSDGTVHVWESATGKRILTYEEHSDTVLSVAWSPDGTRIASAGCDRTIHVWDTRTGKNQQVYRGNADDVCSVAWSPNGQYLASASYDQNVLVRDSASGERRMSYRSHMAGVFAVAWSSDSRRIASASYDKSVQVHDVASGKALLTYRGHKEGVFALAWSPDGTRIASAGDDNAVHIWFSANGRLQAAYRLHEGGIRGIAWSPDGQYLASGGVDNIAHIWYAA